MNGIAFGQSASARYIKSKRSFDIAYTIEDNVFTGGGKSITFQVPALAQEGVCIVITPLIALMKDQVDHLRHKGIPAAAIYSGMTRDAIVATLENCIFGGVKLLYISPERIGSDIFQVKLRHMKVSFITVDEAHCISQWGYDFRPSYLQITEIRKLVPHAPILALMIYKKDWDLRRRTPFA